MKKIVFSVLNDKNGKNGNMVKMVKIKNFKSFLPYIYINIYTNLFLFNNIESKGFFYNKYLK